MKWKMLFRIGLTIVILVAILLFYLNNVLHRNSKDKISELVRSENLAFEEALVRHGHENPNLGKEGNKETGGHGPKGESNQNGALKVDGGNGDEGEDDLPGEDDSLNVENGKGHRPQGAADSAQSDHKEGKLAPDGLVIHWDSAVRGASSGLQPLHRRVGKQVNVQVHLIHLAVVACGDRGPEVMVMLKSAVVLTTSAPLVLHIFAERDLHDFFTKQLNFWPAEVLDRVEYRVYDIVFPIGDSPEEWRKLFKPCASFRLFLPTLLTDVDSLVYVDTDVLFLSPLHKIWAFFSRFNATQLVALAPEHEDSNTGWYNRFARHPYVPPLGVNSGVMLMNLTRLRGSTWLLSMMKFYKEYRLKLTWGDQDLINIYFHYHPDELYVYSCEWNYRPDHCMYMSVCKPAEQHGAFVVHGARRVMHNDKQPAFKAIYNAFQSYKFGQDVELVLLESMKKNLQETRLTQCGKVSHIFLKQVQEFVMETRDHPGNHPADHPGDHRNHPPYPEAPPAR